MNPFTRAADYLTEHGWAQRIVRDPATGRVCAFGALLFGNPDATERKTGQLVWWLSRFIASRLELDLCPGSSQMIPYWNDRIAKSQEEVMTMLREAAEAWELETMVATPAPDAIEVPGSWIPSAAAVQSGFTLDSWVAVQPTVLKQLAVAKEQLAVAKELATA